MRQEFVGKVRLLTESGDFADWLDESLAQAKVNAGTHIEVFSGRLGNFFGIKPAPTVYKESHSTPASITCGEMEINAGLYSGHGSEAERFVKPSNLHRVRRKVAAFQRASWADRIVTA